MSPPPPPDPAGSADSPDWTGRIIGGRYRVDSVLGVGGMGTAYRAYDQKLERSVVLKVPHARHFSAGESRGRFQDEIRKLIAIEHPHVVRVYDVGDEDGTPYAVFPFLAGGSLGARMKALGQRLTPDEVVPWLTQIADALDDLHARGDIHRDVKPDNILFDKPLGQGKANAYLADFGLAKALGIDPDRLFQSRTGVLIGTQAYMAPEQFSRRAPVTGAVDQYALATTVYQALSGRMPFAVSSSEELAVAKAIETPRPLSEVAQFVSNSIERAVMRGLATDPKARFRTCAEFAKALAAQAEGQPSRASMAPPVQTVEAPRAAPASSPVRAASPHAPRRATKPAPPVAPSLPVHTRARADAPSVRHSSRVPLVVAVLLVAGGLGGAGWVVGWYGDRGAPARQHESVAVSPTPVPPPTPTPVPTTPPAMEADPAPAAMEAAPPAEPAMVEMPPSAPVVPVAPAWKAHIEAAKAAGKAADWIVAERELDLATEKEVPASEVPKSLEDGVRDWKAPVALTITSPAEATTVATDAVEVRWILLTPRAKDVASLVVNGKPVPASRLGRSTVSLVEGENRIEIVVRDDKGGERAKQLVRVTREQDWAVAPPWAKVAPDQLAEARRLRTPVAFENSIGMRFVLVPAGTFTMGSPRGEEGHESDETPHRVTLTQSFYVAIHETTNEDYRRFKWNHSSGARGDRSVESLNAGSQPAANVSQVEAMAYAAWLSELDTGRAYRLPTEAEWEYACRAGTTTSRYWGDDEEGLAKYANIADSRAKAKFGFSWASAWDDGFAAASPVGAFLPNGWGLYDMIGNVWEWCSDWKADYPTGSATDPTGPTSGSSRVLRGGSWHANAASARAAGRISYDPDVRGDYLGIRLVAAVRPPR